MTALRRPGLHGSLTWSIVLLTYKPDPRYLAPFEARLDEGLPGFVEIYIRKDLGVELTKL